MLTCIVANKLSHHHVDGDRGDDGMALRPRLSPSPRAFGQPRPQLFEAPGPTCLPAHRAPKSPSSADGLSMTPGLGDSAPRPQSGASERAPPPSYS